MEEKTRECCLAWHQQCFRELMPLLNYWKGHNYWVTNKIKLRVVTSNSLYQSCNGGIGEGIDKMLESFDYFTSYDKGVFELRVINLGFE